MHGGREVLRITLDLPRGDCRAAEHFAALAAAFADFAKARFLPSAAKDCEACFSGGRGYAFRAYRARAALALSPIKQGYKIEFSASAAAGGEPLFHRTLTTFWSADGKTQRKRLKEGKRAKLRKSAVPKV